MSKTAKSSSAPSIKELISFSTISYLVVLGWSLFSYQNYYDIFGINIVKYSSINELLLRFFLDLAIPYFLGLLFTALITFIASHYFSKYFIDPTNSSKVKKSLPIILILLLLIFCVELLFVDIKSYQIKIVIYSFISAILTLFSILIYESIKKKLIGLLILMSLFVFGYITIEYSPTLIVNINRSKILNREIYSVKGDTLKVNSKNFIGSTATHIFLLDSNDNSMIYRATDNGYKLMESVKSSKELN